MRKGPKYGPHKAVQDRVWHLMIWSNGEWQPSRDYPTGWRTKKAALSKIKQLGEKGKMYLLIRYDVRPGQ